MNKGMAFLSVASGGNDPPHHLDLESEEMFYSQEDPAVKSRAINGSRIEVIPLSRDKTLKSVPRRRGSRRREAFTGMTQLISFLEVLFGSSWLTGMLRDLEKANLIPL